MTRFQASKPHKFGKTACVVTIRYITGLVHGIVDWGARGIRVEIECYISDNLPAIVVASASKSVDEAKERVRATFADAGLQLPRKLITINFAPADLPKTNSSFGATIATPVLAASKQISLKELDQTALIGELCLDGTCTSHTQDYWQVTHRKSIRNSLLYYSA